MKILLIQLQANEIIDAYKEFIEEHTILSDLKTAVDLILEYLPDLVVFPEICYVPELRETLIELSNGRTIVAGSYYDNNNVNTTVIFNNKEVIYLPKIYPSPDEPMFLLKEENEVPMDVINKWESIMKLGEVPEYFVTLNNGKQIAVLNCMDYYKLAYYIARSPILSKNMIALVSPCSNSNVQLFIEESQAIHNHNSEVYSIVVNSVASLNGKQYSVGSTYVFGMNDAYTHSFYNSQKHPALVARLGNKKQAVYIETRDDFSRFKRNDKYMRNPKIIKYIDF